MFGEYIDSHNHMHALSWDEWELLGATGMRAGRDTNKSFPAVFPGKCSGLTFPDFRGENQFKILG